MTLSAVLQMGLFLVLLLALAAPLGAYLARVYTGEARWAQRLGGPSSASSIARPVWTRGRT
jgi:K+-transporting ATPase A subunit